MTKKKELDLKPIEMNTPKANKMRELLKLAKTSPKLKELYLKRAHPEGVEQTGTPIPVNVTLGEYEDQILPFVATEYFIKKAGTILLIDCPCRRANNCKNHDHHLGCTWMGEGARHVDLTKWPVANGRYATKEEALERERLAYENGLVPHLGKFRGDAELYNVVDYEDQFMSICHCCSCCCVVSLAKYGPSEYKQIIKRMEGVEVRIDPDKCQGCGACFKVCIYNGLKMENDKAVINQDNCMGCGRCEMTCPNKAVTVSIDDYSRLDELIARFESRVDISG